MTKNGLVSFFNEGCLYKKKQGREKIQRGERKRERGRQREVKKDKERCGREEQLD